MDGAIVMLEQLADGVGSNPTLNITHNTKTLLLAKRAEAVAARDNYELSKQSIRIVRQALERSRLKSRALIMLSRETLKPNLGDEFNENWMILGYDGSLATAVEVNDVALQAEKFKNFFTANPTLEVASKDVTAAKFDELHEALVEGRKAVNDKDTELTQMGLARDAKFEELRKRIRFTIDELSGILDPFDPRWKSFGLNIPGAQETPDVPEGVQVVLIGPNAAATKWGASARADYYRVWLKVHGLDTEPRAVGSPADLDFTIENLPAASQVDIMISALNNGGESALSEPITITTH